MNFKFQISNFKSLILICVFCVPVFSFEPNNTDNIVPATGDFKQDAKAFPNVVWEDSKKTFFDSDNLFLLLMAGGGSIALQDRADENIAEHFRENGKMSKDLDKFTDIVGGPGIHFAATGIWYWLAARNNDNVNLQRSWVMFRALTVTGATTLLLKGTVQNHTPNGKDWAWPSGHTSSSFAVAAVLDEFYGPKIGVPAYLGAGFVGYRMMESGDHWASDVLFGGVLGYVVGHAIAGENKPLELAGFNVQPLVTTLHAKPSAGIAFAKRF
ncbi:MAG: phosphatase PAP2 family protein [Phycisphaerae bacterium]|nr:phosphatase PAP2 family protein [Phycisphaerae bacterium]